MPDVNVPLGKTTWRRDYAGGVDLLLLNRFFEEDPSSSQDPTALIRRPGTAFYRAFGSGPMRGNFTQEGLFGDDLFVVSGSSLARWDGTTETAITGGITGDAPVSMTYQASPGVERLWLADGTTLFYYEGEGKASGNLDGTAQVSAGDTVEIGGIYYEFVASGVDTGSPAGSLANPWRVLIGIDLENSLLNLGEAIDNSGTPGSTYSTALTAHPNVETRRNQPSRIIVQARTAGAAGNSITTTETSAVLTWGNGTLENGGSHLLIPVAVPEGGSESAKTVTALAGHVIISVAGSQRMYFVRPGEFFVEIFAEAESEPDELLQVITVGDFLWAIGRSTIEPWAPTGDADVPFAPVAGRAKRYGMLEGSAVPINNDVIYTDTSGIVRDSEGRRLSNHAIEEAVRLEGVS